MRWVVVIPEFVPGAVARPNAPGVGGGGPQATNNPSLSVVRMGLRIPPDGLVPPRDRSEGTPSIIHTYTRICPCLPLRTFIAMY